MCLEEFLRSTEPKGNRTKEKKNKKQKCINTHRNCTTKNKYFTKENKLLLINKTNEFHLKTPIF